MKLKDGFYICSSREQVEGGFEAEVGFNAGHAIFDGHFPGQPIVPGVCTLTIIRELLGEETGRQIRYTSIKECKFTGAIDPRTDAALHLIVKTDGVQLCATADCNGRNILKLKATIGDNC